MKRHVVLITATILLTAASARAATSFEETWQATRFLTVHVYQEGRDVHYPTGDRVVIPDRTGTYPQGYCLGPAEWEVSGTLGTRQFAEVWRSGVSDRDDLYPPARLTGWRASDRLISIDPKRNLYTFSDLCEINDAAASRVGPDGGSLAFNPVGLYGWFGGGNQAGGFDTWDVKNDLHAASAYPILWQISGHISD